VWRVLLKNKLSVLSEGPTVTGDTSLAMMENTALRHVPVGTVFQLDGAPPHFCHRFVAFLDRSFLIVGLEEGDPFPGPLVLQFYCNGFFLGVC